ncbi:MAG: hypothetical protein ACREFC_00105, partial [Stellaceae bacterium]
MRRDPRAERQARPASATMETTSPSGRIRRDPRGDPRAPRNLMRIGTPPDLPAAKPAAPPIVIDNPACLILAVPDLEDWRLSSHDLDLLGAARLLADSGHGAVGQGAVIVFAASTSKEDFSLAGADRLVAPELGAGYTPENKTAAVLACIEALNPRHVLFCETPTGGGDIGRRVAAALGEAPAARVMRLSANEAASRGNGGRSDYLRPPPRLLFIAAETADPPLEAKREARSLPAPIISTATPRIEDRGIAATDPNA